RSTRDILTLYMNKPQKVANRNGYRPIKNSEEKFNRRECLQKSAVVAGSAALGNSSLYYSRIVGANERIALGHIGVGVRGRELQGMAAELKTSKNVEMTAVCDLWTVNLERAIADAAKYYGRAP